jgi:hypothetical protein
MLNKDLFKLLSHVPHKTNVLKHSVILQEDAYTNQLFAMLSQEEQHTNVTQQAESVNVSFLLATIRILAPLINMLKELDAPTLLNANPITFVLLLLATQPAEIATLLTKIAMTETHVLMILATKFLETASTLQKLAHAQLEMLDSVTQLLDNVLMLLHVELPLTAMLDKFVTQPEDVSYQLTKIILF